MRIRVLADDVVNKIAAGEVVDRPSAVVRELVDNALDAGAQEITVSLEEGGQRLIRVSDDGCGMGRDDALLAFERHATSKLSSADDLLSLSTLGFRGEALPSIAAVSKVLLRTRQPHEGHATEVTIEGGKIRDVRDAASAPGTTIEVRSLFFNTPARKKFLKSVRSEELRIKSWLTSVAIGRPEVRFRVFSDEREILNLPRHDSMMVRAEGIYRGASRPVSATQGDLSITGLLGHPSLAQMDSSALVLIVNGRVISDRLILKAVREGFDSTLKDREFPAGFISLTLSPADVDVNVHPQKSEVRFRNSGDVFAFTRDAVLRAVRSFSSPVVPQSEQGEESETLSAPAVRALAASFPPSYAAPRGPGTLAVQEAPSLFTATATRKEAVERTAESAFRFSNLRYIGQLFECYLLTEYAGSLYVVDMHAAHERYNYNRIRADFARRSADSQQLLMPVQVALSERGVDSCVQYQELFASLGFEWDAIGPTSLAVRAVPSYFRDARLIEVVKEVAALAEGMDPKAAFIQHVDRIAARLACHASIRSGKLMEREEVYALFADLDSSEFSAACPHGRPVVISFSERQVESWFGRDR